MNHDDPAIKALRILRPAALPEELRRSMACPPAEPASAVTPAICHTPRSATGVRRVRVLMASSALAAMAACMVLIIQPASRGEAPPLPVSVMRTESELVSRRTLGMEEHDGRLWERVEEEWRNESVAACSATPVRARLTETRVVEMLRPVDFL